MTQLQGTSNTAPTERQRLPSPEPFQGRRWISVREVAEYLGLHLKSCYDLIAQGKLPAARVGRVIRIDVRALDAELERQANGNTAAPSYLAR